MRRPATRADHDTRDAEGQQGRRRPSFGQSWNRSRVGARSPQPRPALVLATRLVCVEGTRLQRGSRAGGDGVRLGQTQNHGNGKNRDHPDEQESHRAAHRTPVREKMLNVRRSLPDGSTLPASAVFLKPSLRSARGAEHTASRQSGGSRGPGRCNAVGTLGAMPNGAALDHWLARHRRGFLILLDALAWALSLTAFTLLRYLDVSGGHPVGATWPPASPSPSACS